MAIKTKFHIFSENIYPEWEIDEKKYITSAKKLLKYYLSKESVYADCALNGFEYNTISFDILYLPESKTRELSSARFFARLCTENMYL